MPTQNGVNTPDSARHFKVHIHAVMGQNDNDLSALCPGLIDRVLHVFFVDAKGPVFNQVARVRDGSIGERLTDDGDFDPIHFTHGEGIKHGVTEISGFDILRYERDFVGKIVFYNLHHAIFAKCHFPVGCHDIYSQCQTGIHHVLAISPQCRTGPLPGVSTV